MILKILTVSKSALEQDSSHESNSRHSLGVKFKSLLTQKWSRPTKSNAFHCIKARRAGARYEAEQSVSTNMATVTVYFQRRLELSLEPVDKCLRAVLGLVRWRQDSNFLKAHIFTAILIPNNYATVFTMFAQKDKAEEIGKGKVRFVCRSYRIFGQDSFLNISTHPRNFATKRDFKALTKTL